jgi:hypothetical protein
MLLQDDEKNLLGDLQVGEAIVRLQGRSVKPFKISVPEFSITKGAFTDTKVMRHMTQLGLLSVRRQPVQHTQTPQQAPAPEIQRVALGSQSNTAAVSSPDHLFLVDIQTYPDSGIAERYKRLGLSVRQGQKIKHRFLAAGIIEEQLQTTHSGKLRVIRLTEQGRLAMEDQASAGDVQPPDAESVQFTRQESDDAVDATSPSAASDQSPE